MARKVKYDSDPKNDYSDGYNAGRRYKGDKMAKKSQAPKSSKASQEQLERQQNIGAVTATPNSDDSLPTDNSTVGNPFAHSNDGLGRAYDPAVDGTGKDAEKAQAEADKAPEDPGTSVAQQKAQDQE